MPALLHKPKSIQMIRYQHGNLMDSPAQTLVNPVNTVGVMGKGLALLFKQQYPAMFKQYKTLCSTGDIAIGKLWLYKSDAKWVLNFPTKQHWRSKSKLEYVEAGLRAFVAMYADAGITSAAFPMLGCGAGGLDWRTQVRPLMEQYLSSIPIGISIYLYGVDADKS
ncbi:MAG: macro domain-containing protein [Chloroflexota bacterium]